MAGQQSLVDYFQGFQRSSEPWPPLPLADDITVDWCRHLLAEVPSGLLQGERFVESMQAVLPQLRLPQVPGISRSEIYRRLVLRGEEANPADLSSAGPEPLWQQGNALRLWLAPHPCGAMPVLSTSNWSDFCLLVNALAHRCDPVALVLIPTVIPWRADAGAPT